MIPLTHNTTHDFTNQYFSLKSSRESSPVAKVPTSPLFSHGVCKWPGCDTECADINEFQRYCSISDNNKKLEPQTCLILLYKEENLIISNSFLIALTN